MLGPAWQRRMLGGWHVSIATCSCCTLTLPCFPSPPLHEIPQELVINSSIPAKLPACSRKTYETWQAIGFLHGQQNLPKCHLDSCELETLQAQFFTYASLRIAVAMHEVIKLLAIKLIFGTTRAVGVNSFIMEIPVKWQL